MNSRPVKNQTGDNAPRLVYPSKLANLPLHPFLFTIYPVLMLYAANIEATQASDVRLPLLYGTLGAVILMGIFFLITRDVQRAALASSLILVLFFSYGHIYEYLEQSVFW